MNAQDNRIRGASGLANQKVATQRDYDLDLRTSFEFLILKYEHIDHCAFGRKG